MHKFRLDTSSLTFLRDSRARETHKNVQNMASFQEKRELR